MHAVLCLISIQLALALAGFLVVAHRASREIMPSFQMAMIAGGLHLTGIGVAFLFLKTGAFDLLVGLISTLIIGIGWQRIILWQRQSRYRSYQEKERRQQFLWDWLMVCGHLLATLLIIWIIIRSNEHKISYTLSLGRQMILLTLDTLSASGILIACLYGILCAGYRRAMTRSVLWLILTAMMRFEILMILLVSISRTSPMGIFYALRQTWIVSAPFFVGRCFLGIMLPLIAGFFAITFLKNESLYQKQLLFLATFIMILAAEIMSASWMLGLFGLNF